MSDLWKMNDAAAHFEEVVNTALTNAPQLVLRNDGKMVIVMSEAHHDRLTEALRRLVALGGTPPDPVLLPLDRMEEEDRRARRQAGFLHPVAQHAQDDDLEDDLVRILEREREVDDRALRLASAMRDSTGS